MSFAKSVVTIAESTIIGAFSGLALAANSGNLFKHEVSHGPIYAKGDQVPFNLVEVIYQGNFMQLNGTHYNAPVSTRMEPIIIQIFSVIAAGAAIGFISAIAKKVFG